MLIPGFVTIYKDNSDKIHLYFYPGIDNFNQYYYNTLDLSDAKVKYKEIKHIDGACEFIFDTKNIIKITLIITELENNTHVKTATN